MMPVGLGLLLGIPIAFVAASLLMAADAGMDNAMDRLFGGFRFGNILSFLLRTAIVTVLFFSVYDHALRKPPRTVREVVAAWNPLTVATVTAMLLCVYAVYVVVQFQYLFGARLPAEMTYSDYAREGFVQLIAVACINFLLFGLTERYARKTAAGTVMQTLLLVATALILSSALVRLLLYIGAYGLTMKRILSLWAMVYLAVLTVLSAVRLCRLRMPLLRIAGMVLLYWYAAFALVPWDTVMAVYNQSRFGIVG